MLQYEYAREALKNGLKLEAEVGSNPFKFGMIGSTDSHTALSTADDNNFFGKHSGVKPNPNRATDHVVIEGEVGKIMSFQMTASGYAAVWARENTRKSLFWPVYDATCSEPGEFYTGCRRLSPGPWPHLSPRVRSTPILDSPPP